MTDAAATMEHLLAREACLEENLQAVSSTVIGINSESRITSFSASAEAMFGWTAADALGWDVSALLAPPYRDLQVSYLDHHFRHGEPPTEGLARIVVGERRDGTRFPMSLSIRQVQMGGARTHMGFLRDLSDRQAAEQRLRALQEELEHMSRLMGLAEMSAALGHELNQPLTAITNCAGAALLYLRREQPDIPTACDIVEQIQNQTQRATDVIRSLRDFARKGDADRRQEDLPSLVEEAATLVVIATQDRSARLDYEFAETANLVVVDKIAVQQVLVNLLRNAMEAMSGLPERRLRISSRETESGMVEVAIRDSGPGLNSVVAQNLFRPFNTTKANGMGVGLSISKTIIEGHGGQIWAEPNEEGGAVFRFTLPSVGRRQAPGGGMTQ